MRSVQYELQHALEARDMEVGNLRMQLQQQLRVQGSTAFGSSFGLPTSNPWVAAEAARQGKMHS
eukprot:6456648-Amphidinium_carterae.2